MIYAKEPTDTMDTSRSRKMSTSCLTVNLSPEQMSPIDAVVEGGNRPHVNAIGENSAPKLV